MTIMFAIIIIIIIDKKNCVTKNRTAETKNHHSGRNGSFFYGLEFFYVGRNKHDR